MKKIYFLLVGYNIIEQTELCHFLTDLHLSFNYAAVQNVAEAKSFLLEHRVDFIISHPKTTEYMNFIDLIRQNTSIGIIKPSCYYKFAPWFMAASHRHGTSRCLNC